MSAPNVKKWGEMKAKDMALYFTVKDLMKRFKVKERAIYNMVARGDGPRPIRIGRLLRWPIAEVKRWEEERRNSDD